MRKTIHQAAQDYFGVDFSYDASGTRNEGAKKMLECVPMFTDVAGPGDHQLAADLIIQAIDSQMKSLLDFIMLARPSFNSEGAHALFAMEVAYSLQHQMERCASALAGGASARVMHEVMQMPREKQVDIMRRSHERTLARMEQMFKDAPPDEEPN